MFRISHPEFRAASKIAFGYAAHVCGADLARLPLFDIVRRFVLYDERPERRIVDVVRASEVSSLGHALSITQNPDGKLSANITLHFRFLYKVQLTQAPISETIEDTTHFFDAVTRRVHQVS